MHSGQPVAVAEVGHGACTGAIEDLAPDAAILWVRLSGIAPRRMFLHTDPVNIHPAQ